MKTIAITNRRGGVGKTATAGALGAGIARKGFRVLLVDLDSQSNLTFDTGAKAGGRSAMDMLTGSATAGEVITKKEPCDIIPGCQTLATADMVITETGKEYRLREALQEVAPQYDYCIIDTPPALGVITTNALTAADLAIIPAQAEIHSMQGAGLLQETIEAVRKYTNRDLKIDGILITRYNGRAIISRDMRENLKEMAEALGTKIYKTEVRECVAIKEAQAAQTNIFEYAPQSNAAADYEAIINEILEGGEA